MQVVCWHVACSLDCGNDGAGGVKCWEFVDMMAEEMCVAAERCCRQAVSQSVSVASKFRYFFSGLFVHGI